MDKKITVRFYQVQRHREADLSFPECLERIFENFHGIYRELDEDLYIRLERKDIDGEYIKGEFTRKQTVNLPPKVITDSLEASVDPIAHRVAFQYSPRLSIIAIEHSRNGMSLARINKYIIDTLGHAGFEFAPVLTENAWDSLLEGTPRKLILKVANPQNLSMVDANASSRSLFQSLSTMREMVGGPVVEASIGFGRGERDGSLNKRTIASALRNLLAPINTHNVQKVQIKLEEESEPIDLLSEQLKFKETLDLDDTNIENHYRKRSAFIGGLFRRNLEFLRSVYERAA